MTAGTSGNLPTASGPQPPAVPPNASRPGRLKASDITLSLLEKATSEAERNSLMRSYKEAVAIEEKIKENAHRRTMEIVGKVSEVTGRLISIGIGCVLMYDQNLELGAFFVAVGVNFIAPKFISNVFKKFL